MYTNECEELMKEQRVMRINWHEREEMSEIQPRTNPQGCKPCFCFFLYFTLFALSRCIMHLCTTTTIVWTPISTAGPLVFSAM